MSKEIVFQFFLSCIRGKPLQVDIDYYYTFNSFWVASPRQGPRPGWMRSLSILSELHQKTVERDGPIALRLLSILSELHRFATANYWLKVALGFQFFLSCIRDWCMLCLRPRLLPFNSFWVASGYVHKDKGSVEETTFNSFWVASCMSCQQAT